MRPSVRVVCLSRLSASPPTVYIDYNTYQLSHVHVYIAPSWWWATSKPEIFRGLNKLKIECIRLVSLHAYFEMRGQQNIKLVLPSFYWGKNIQDYLNLSVVRNSFPFLVWFCDEIITHEWNCQCPHSSVKEVCLCVSLIWNLNVSSSYPHCFMSLLPSLNICMRRWHMSAHVALNVNVTGQRKNT
jgi:hypothetical protein